MSDAARQWALLSDQEVDEETLDSMSKRRGGYYRTKSIRSGDMLEIEAYPMLPRAEERALRKRNPTPEAMRKLNEKNARKRFRRLAEINFSDRADYYFTGTIESRAGESLPSLSETEKIFKAFTRRLNRKRKRAGLENAKYMAVIEGYEEGSKTVRLHVHALIEGGLSRDAVEELWTAGLSQCRRLSKPMLDRLCGYLLKDPRGKKRWHYSKGNLRQPVVRVADRKITSKAAWRVASDTEGRAAALEKLYPGYRLEKIDVKGNPYVPGVYITARLWRSRRQE